MLSHSLLPAPLKFACLTAYCSPTLTWRDVQYLLVYTSNPRPLMENKGKWYKNGAGLWVSNQFGFGAVDAEAIVRRARRWINVPEQISEEHVPSSSTRCSILFKTIVLMEDVVLWCVIIILVDLLIKTSMWKCYNYSIHVILPIMQDCAQLIKISHNYCNHTSIWSGVTC